MLVCYLCGKAIKDKSFKEFCYMNKEGVLIVRERGHYQPHVRLIIDDGLIEKLPVHRKCRQWMRMSEYVRKEYRLIC